MLVQTLRRNKQGISKNPLKSADFRGFLVRVTRFERAISTSQMWRGTNSATPGYSVFAIIPCCGQKSKIFLSVVIPVVRAAFRPGCVPWGNPANARAARLPGLRLLRPWMVSTALPNVARYQLRYTRIFNFCYYTTVRAKIKVFPVCGQSCGQSRFSACFLDLQKSRKRPFRKAFLASASQVMDGVHRTPKSSAIPPSLHPD